MSEPISDDRSPTAPVLADLDELFREVEQDLDQRTFAPYSPATARSAAGDLAQESISVADYLREETVPFLQAAAVLHTYDPARLRPVGVTNAPNVASGEPGSLNPVSRLLEYSTLVVGTDQTIRDASGDRERVSARWQLRDDVRQAVLKELVTGGQAVAALDANREMADAADPVQHVLTDALVGSLKPLGELPLNELTALDRVAPWLEGLDLPVQLPSAEDRTRRLQRESLLDSFRHLVGHWENGRFVEHFRGRERELRKLRGFVDVTHSQSVLEGAERGLKGAARSLFNLQRRPPLVIHGPGGIGKSTLIAKFLLEHAEAQEDEQYPFVYIDFDHPDVASVDPRSLLAEAARQLSAQYPAAEQRLLALHERLQREMASGGSSQSPVAEHIKEFRDIYRQYMQQNRPFLLVLDTLEEVQQRSRDYVYVLFQFLDDLQGAIPRLRAVLAGRAPVTEEDAAGVKADNYLLGDLDQEAAVGFLQSRGIGDAKVARDVAALVGGQPLALNLAADFVREHGLDEIRDAVGGTGVVARLRRTWAKTDVTGRLYERLLQHIVDPDVRKLAHPGLVLRRITAEIIRDVLAEPCDLTLSQPGDESDLFQRLRREVSLVAPDGPDVLRHRADVRAMMLPLILADQPERARLIQEAAVRFYESRTGPAPRAEEIYHRLMLGEPLTAVAPRWQDGLDQYLTSALDDLQAPAQAFVAARVGAERPDVIWQAAELPDWERYAERRARDLLRLGNPTEATKTLAQRGERSSNSRLLGIEALVLSAWGRTEEARTMAGKAVDVYRDSSTNEDLIRELQPLLYQNRSR